MSVRTEYWWVRHNAEIQPAEVGFIGGIPARIRFIGASESIAAASAELIERLPAAPAQIMRMPEPVPVPVPKQSNALLWLLSIILLLVVAQYSGQLFDAIK
jgi:hypothetical protein